MHRSLVSVAAVTVLSSCTVYSWVSPKLSSLDRLPYPVPVVWVTQLDANPQQTAMYQAVADVLRNSPQLVLQDEPQTVQRLTAEAVLSREKARAEAHAREVQERLEAERQRALLLADATGDVVAAPIEGPIDAVVGADPAAGDDADPVVGPIPVNAADGARPDAAGPPTPTTADPARDTAGRPDPQAPGDTGDLVPPYAPAPNAPDAPDTALPADNPFWVPAPGKDGAGAAGAAPNAGAGVAEQAPTAADGTAGAVGAVGATNAAGVEPFEPNDAVDAQVACSVGARMGVPMVVLGELRDSEEDSARMQVSLLVVETCDVHAAFMLSAGNDAAVVWTADGAYGEVGKIGAALAAQAAAQIDTHVPRQSVVTSTRGSVGISRRTHGGKRRGDTYAARRNGDTYGIAVMSDIRGGAGEFTLLDGRDQIRVGDQMVRSDVDCCYSITMPVSGMRIDEDGVTGGIRTGVGLRYRKSRVGRASLRWGFQMDWFPSDQFSLLSGGGEVGASLSLLPNRVRLGVTVGGAVATSWLGEFGSDAQATSYGAYATGTVELALRLGHRFWLGVEGGDVRSVGFGSWDVDADSPIESPDDLPSLSLRGPILRFGLTYGPP